MEIVYYEEKDVLIILCFDNCTNRQEGNIGNFHALSVRLFVVGVDSY